MNLYLNRRELSLQRTIGDLYIEDHLYCQTLEDTVREPGVKIPGETAIPPGKYEIRLTYSNRFRHVMPQVMRVPNYEGIRIHPGNSEKDSSGCILLGKQQGDHLVNSRDTYNDLMDVLERCKESIYITIQ